MTGTCRVCTNIVFVLLHHIGTLRNRHLYVYLFNHVYVLHEPLSLTEWKMFYSWLSFVFNFWFITLQCPTVVSKHWRIPVALVSFLHCINCPGETAHRVRHWQHKDSRGRSPSVSEGNELEWHVDLHFLVWGEKFVYGFNIVWRSVIAQKIVNVFEGFPGKFFLAN